MILTQQNRSHAFSLVELLVVIFILGVLLTLLLPTVNSARESARRMGCQNNLKQIGIGLNSFESTLSRYPVGAQKSITFGVSWWVEILPFIDEADLFHRIELKGSHSGSPMLHAKNGKLVHGFKNESMLCSSSTLPALSPVGNYQVLMPSYVGISGATNHDGFLENRISPCCSSDKNAGQISGGGVLIANASVRMREVFDGLSKTLVVGETSGAAIRPNGSEARVDGGYPQGWITGTSASGTPPNYNPSFSPSSWNITTLRYPPNIKTYASPGLGSNRGANNPLISAHPGGVNTLFADGSVKYLSNDIDVLMLKAMATRDDGKVF